MCDPDQSGFILPEKLHNILSGFCFPLTKDQFEDLVSNVREYGNTINYHEFLKMFRKSPDEVRQILQFKVSFNSFKIIIFF